MSEYVGLQEQINRNNTRSILLLIAFPVLVLGAFYAVVAFASRNGNGGFDSQLATQAFMSGLPMVVLAVGIWFLIAYLSHSAMINLSTGAHTLERKEHMRVYNLTENLCMSVGMKMPKLQIII